MDSVVFDQNLQFSKTGFSNTVELQWLEHLWDHKKLFEAWVVQVTEG